MHLNITKRLAAGDYSVQIAIYVLCLILWFLPDLSASLGVAPSENVPVLFMKSIELWRWPMWVSRIVALPVYALLVFYIYSECEQYQILPPHTHTITALLPLLLAVNGYAQVFDHRLIALVFEVLLVRQLFNIYYHERQVQASFGVVLCAGLASLFEPASIWLMLFIVPALLLYHLSSLKFVSGIFLAVLLLVSTSVGAFWIADKMDVLLQFVAQYIGVDFDITLNLFRRSDVVMAIVMVVSSLVVSVLFGKDSVLYKLNLRLNTILVIILFWISVAWTAVFIKQFEHNVILPMILMSIFMSSHFATNHNKSDNILLITLFVVSIAYRLLWMFGY